MELLHGSRSASRFRVVRAAERPSSRERRPFAFAACTGFRVLLRVQHFASANSLKARGRSASPRRRPAPASAPQQRACARSPFRSGERRWESARVLLNAELASGCHLRAGPIWLAQRRARSGAARCDNLHFTILTFKPETAARTRSILRQLEGAIGDRPLSSRRRLWRRRARHCSCDGAPGWALTDPPPSESCRGGDVLRSSTSARGAGERAPLRDGVRSACLDRAPAVERESTRRPSETARAGARSPTRRPAATGVGSVLHPSRGCVHVENVAG